MSISVEDATASSDQSTEKQLACAVLQQAVQDIHMAGRDGRVARIFLTAESGPWARSRHFWADVAGIDPAALNDAVRRQLAATEAPRRRDTRVLAKGTYGRQEALA